MKKVKKWVPIRDWCQSQPNARTGGWGLSVQRGRVLAEEGKIRLPGGSLGARVGSKGHWEVREDAIHVDGGLGGRPNKRTKKLVANNGDR